MNHLIATLLLVANVGNFAQGENKTSERDRRQVAIHFAQPPGQPPANTLHLSPGLGHFALPVASPYRVLPPHSPSGQFSLFASPHQTTPFGYTKITSIKPAQLTGQFQVTKQPSLHKPRRTYKPHKSGSKKHGSFAPAPYIHPHGNPNRYQTVTPKPRTPFILSHPPVTLARRPYHPIAHGYNSHSVEYDDKECPDYTYCMPLVSCAPHYQEVRKTTYSPCYLYNQIQGVCCPKQKQKKGYGKPLFREPEINVPIRSFSVYELNEAARAGLWDLTERDILENTLQERGIVVSQRRRPEWGHLQFFKTTVGAQSRARDALKSELTTNRLVQKFRLSPREAGYGLRQVSVENTIIGDVCPERERCGEKENYYRTIDGSCNNLRNPSWGKAMTQLQRALPPFYPDGFQSPRDISVIDRIRLPSPRVVSLSNVVDVDNPHPDFTLMVMQWGQLIDHDLTHVPIFRFGNSSGVECCNEQGQLVDGSFTHPACIPIELPGDDPFFGKLRRTCMNFIRSMSAPSCGFGYKEQMNQITAFLDGSAIYGSNEEEEGELRLRRGGLMKVSEKRLLPPNENNNQECDANNNVLDCFVAGDSRVNEQPSLTSIHTIWHREHNRVARMLLEYNPHWSDETTFQEARRIVVAEVQHINYNEWLPIILGKKFMVDNDLLPKTQGFYTGYDDTINPTILNEFATVAFRFGHTLVQGTFNLFGKDHRKTENVRLRDNFNSPNKLYEPGKLDEFLRGLAKQPIQNFDNFVSEDLTNRLFQTREMPFGMDLVALNIQRGRDHGIAPYNDMREACGLPRARRFEDLLDYIPSEIVATYKLLYPSVDDIDPFVAGISERPQNDGLLGPTFACIIGDQFIRIKKGDRFFYENGNMASAFTEAQLYEIRQTSLARIMCDNGDYMRHMQPLAFWKPSKLNEKTSCDSPSIPSLNFLPWKSVGSTKK